MLVPARRRFLQHGVLLAALFGSRSLGAALLEDAELPYLGAVQALRAMAANEFSAELYVETLLAAQRACEYLNAFISTDPEALLAAARQADRQRREGKALGPLHGLPLVVKDNINTAELPTSGGTPALKDNRPTGNAPVAARLFEAGALLAGKTNLHELAFGITSNNAAFGAAANPYNPGMIPGGSSGGTAVAVAARMAPAGLGTDTGGSLRIPAALCGIVGLRPSLGRYPAGGIVPISSTRDTAGPMARSVVDVALLDGVITGAPRTLSPANLRGVRLGVPREYFYRDLDPEVAAASEQALTLLKDLGAALVEADIPRLNELNTAVSFPVTLYEVMRDLPEYLAEYAPEVELAALIQQVASADVAGVLKSQQGDGRMPRDIYQAAMSVHRPALQAACAGYFRDNQLSAMVYPTTPLPARPIGEDGTVRLNGRQAPTFETYIRNTDPASNAGLPALSVPMGMSGARLPMGLEFAGPTGSDRLLLALALAFSEATAPLPAPTACA